MDKVNIIIGIHSIVHALENSDREAGTLYVTDDGLKEIKKYLKGGRIKESIKIYILSTHKLQESAQKYYNENNFSYTRVPSGAFLLTSYLKIYNTHDLLNELKELKNRQLKIFCLDQVTDINNLAAISRTANFFGVDFLCLSQKGELSLTPQMFRISSGAIEHLRIVKCSSLSKLISKLISNEVFCVGLTEHSSEIDLNVDQDRSICLVVGSEDKGISHSVLRLLENKIKLDSQGEIKSLNVSVASALAMAKFFGNH